MSSLIRLSSSDTKLASNLIARALYDYPLFRYLIPDPQQRKKRLPVLSLWSKNHKDNLSQRRID